MSKYLHFSILSLCILISGFYSGPLYLQTATLSDMNDTEHILEKIKLFNNSEQIDTLTMDPRILGMEYKMEHKHLSINFHFEPLNFNRIEGQIEILNDVPSKNDAPIVETFKYKDVTVSRSDEPSIFLFHGKANYRFRKSKKDEMIEFLKRINKSGMYNSLDVQWEEFSELKQAKDSVNIFTSKGWIEVDGKDYQLSLIFSDQENTYYKNLIENDEL